MLLIFVNYLRFHRSVGCASMNARSRRFRGFFGNLACMSVHKTMSKHSITLFGKIILFLPFTFARTKMSSGSEHSHPPSPHAVAMTTPRSFSMPARDLYYDYPPPHSHSVMTKTFDYDFPHRTVSQINQESGCEY